MAGVFFPANGKFYAMGGRTADTAGSEFTHPLEYDPVANSWTTKSATYPDNHVNNMACGVLTDAGTPYIYCVGGIAVTITGHFRSRIPLQPCYRRDQPGCCSLASCHGNGSARWLHSLQQQALYPGRIRHHHERRASDQPDLGVYSVTRRPGYRSPLFCLFRSATYPRRPSAASSTQVAAPISRLALLPILQTPLYITPSRILSARSPSIPRATGETRALNFCNQMYVMGGGRTAPNPSNEVNVYDPVANTLVTRRMPFATARRNFPTATDGTTHIWLSGGYGSDGLTVLDSMEIFSCPVSPCGAPSPTPTATPTATVAASATPTATQRQR